MIKCIALLKMKEGISRSDFMAYYENNHARLILSLLPGIAEYKRNYVIRDARAFLPDGYTVDFDCITELWFDDASAHANFLAAAARPEIADRIARDEENIFDRQATRMFCVDVR